MDVLQIKIIRVQYKPKKNLVYSNHLLKPYTYWGVGLQKIDLMQLHDPSSTERRLDADARDA